MPIYEYRCEDCGTKFEKLVKRDQSDGIECPACGKTHLRRELSTFAAHAASPSKSPEVPACPSGRCRTPELCGLN